MATLVCHGMHLHPAVTDLQGLWLRTSLTTGNGTVDETTAVRRGQVGQFYIDHRLTKIKHSWTNGQVERMNHTIKQATVHIFHYDTHDRSKLSTV
jgi:hypothetical protein